MALDIPLHAVPLRPGEGVQSAMSWNSSRSQLNGTVIVTMRWKGSGLSFTENWKKNPYIPRTVGRSEESDGRTTICVLLLLVLPVTVSVNLHVS